MRCCKRLSYNVPRLILVVILGLLCHVSIRHLTESGCSASYDNTSGCSDPRRIRCELQDDRLGRVFGANCGFLRFDASALSCLGFCIIRLARRMLGNFFKAIQSDSLKRNWTMFTWKAWLVNDLDLISALLL